MGAGEEPGLPSRLTGTGKCLLQEVEAEQGCLQQSPAAWARLPATHLCAFRPPWSQPGPPPPGWAVCLAQDHWGQLTQTPGGKAITPSDSAPP